MDGSYINDRNIFSSLNAIIAYSGKADLLFFSVETRNVEKVDS